MTRPSIGLIVVALLLAQPFRALAYRTAADLPELASQEQVTWATDKVEYYVAAVDYPGASFAAVTEAIADGMAVWSGTECGFERFRYRGTDGLPASGDGRNTVGWYQDNWTEAGFPPGTMAVTDVLYAEVAPDLWEVVEADILVNGHDFRWVSGTPGSDPTVRSIGAVIAHESGHMLGLLHPCEPGASGGVPGCGTDPVFQEATMYPLYTGTDQMILAPDDLNGLCHQFPAIPCDPGCPADMYCTMGTCRESNPSDPDLCLADADCSQTEVCSGSRCVPYIGQLGDTCEQSAECSSNLCAEGHCAESCGPSQLCPYLYSCEPSAELCRASSGEFGDPCEVGEDCVAGVCLSGSWSPAFCTRTCASWSDSSCPIGYRCDDVDEWPVCVPEDSSSGCAAAGHPSRSAPWLPQFALLLSCFVLFTRKRVQS